ncbi:dTDP-glucose-46-dehydratase RfbB protein [Salinisphaera shabanensis E1L3A]|uniref:dTDP-glucose 4,6-dehydratase n=1 Tax=Salinisphaera shabanensis E1L3A TaxID=1033802 RepID=U2FMW1_9GAMM|nr:dTDP-glucose 4,6-dehydratase [Salinisphaera shabanensis]ERJ17534.1 dTDP-glucose-46-dehydratase RfbB protein [Salinisphaera shabanensis E1L3A]
MKILVTGGAGFIGSALIRYLIADTNHSVINLDSLSYAANLEALESASQSCRYTFEHTDIRDSDALGRVLGAHQPDGIIHLAAESHVDRSIAHPDDFITTNIFGTFTLLEAVRAYYEHLTYSRRQAFRFLHVSTDEVYGALGDTGSFSEDSAYAPNSPYAASKASADHLARAWHRTYGLPVVLSHSSNNYGPWQFPEKLIPLTAIKALHGKPIAIYGNGSNVRDWLYVEDHARALVRVFEEGRIGERYNIGAHEESTNLNLARRVCRILDELAPDPDIGSREQLIRFVEDRKGHDHRYAINAVKMQNELAWRPQETLDSGLRRTLLWILDNPAWVEAHLTDDEQPPSPLN